MKDPITSLYQKGKEIYATRDFAQRQAVGQLWLSITFFIFTFESIGIIWLVLLAQDALVLAKYYSSSFMNLWIVDYIQTAIYFVANYMIINLIVFLYTAPKLIRLGITLFRVKNEKERRFYQWLDHKIKKRFPSYKTPEERIKYREEHPRKLTKFELRVKKFRDDTWNNQSLIVRRLLSWILSISLAVAMVTFAIIASSDNDMTIHGTNIKDWILGIKEHTTPPPEKSNFDANQVDNKTWTEIHTKTDRPKTLFDPILER